MEWVCRDVLERPSVLVRVCLSLKRQGLDTGYTADLRFTMHREALRWAADARVEGSYRRAEQLTRASRDSLEEAIKVAAVCLGEGHPKTRALVECLRRFSPFA